MMDNLFEGVVLQVKEHGEMRGELFDLHPAIQDDVDEHANTLLLLSLEQNEVQFHTRNFLSLSY